MQNRKNYKKVAAEIVYPRKSFQPGLGKAYLGLSYRK